MPWTVENPPALMVEQAAALYNAARAPEFPAPAGLWGIDDQVWKALIALMTAKCRTLSIPIAPNGLKGMCIWGSVIAAKFYVLKFAYIDSRVVRVRATASDHYFVVVKGGTQTGICDITCNQFGAPDFIAGTLKDVKGPAQKVKVGNLSLDDAYALGAQSSTFVV